MSADLRDLLADLATDAHNYADPARALAQARRRTIRRRTVAPIVAFLAVAVLVAVPILYSKDRPPAPVGTDSTPMPVEGYPATVRPPTLAMPLPQAPLGSAAAFVYAPCARDCDPYLVLTDGRQYRLDPPTAGFTLSPDGVWLGSPSPGGFLLRNVVTGQTHTVPDAGPGRTNAWVWSPDSTHLLLARHVDGNVDHYLLVNTANATPALVRQFSPLQIPGTAYAIHNNGDVVAWVSGGAGGSTPTLAIVDSGTAAERARFALQMPPNSQLMRPDETLEFGGFYLGPSDDSGLWVIHGPVTSATDVLRPTGFLGVDLAGGGRIWGRTDLPPSAASGAHGDGVWKVRANLAGGVLLVHSAPDRTEIVQMNDINGERTLATTLPVESQLVLRSSARY